MTWLEAKQGAKDCLFFTTRQEKEKVLFPKHWKKREYEIISWIKDFRFRTCDSAVAYRCDAWARDVGEEGFTAMRSGSGNLERLSVSWIVYSKRKRNVESGTFNTEESSGSKGRVTFAEGRFKSTPTVLVAMSQFDIAGGQDLRVGVRVVNVDRTGFNWEICKCAPNASLLPPSSLTMNRRRRHPQCRSNLHRPKLPPKPLTSPYPLESASAPLPHLRLLHLLIPLLLERLANSTPSHTSIRPILIDLRPSLIAKFFERSCGTGEGFEDEKAADPGRVSREVEGREGNLHWQEDQVP